MIQSQNSILPEFAKPTSGSIYLRYDSADPGVSAPIIIAIDFSQDYWAITNVLGTEVRVAGETIISSMHTGINTIERSVQPGIDYTMLSNAFPQSLLWQASAESISVEQSTTDKVTCFKISFHTNSASTFGGRTCEMCLDRSVLTLTRTDSKKDVILHPVVMQAILIDGKPVLVTKDMSVLGVVLVEARTLQPSDGDLFSEAGAKALDAKIRFLSAEKLAGATAPNASGAKATLTPTRSDAVSPAVPSAGPPTSATVVSPGVSASSPGLSIAWSLVGVAVVLIALGVGLKLFKATR